MIHILKKRLQKGILSKPNPEVKKCSGKKGIFCRSFCLRHVDTGECGACASEFLACLNPLYDVQRYGIDVVASPRHADAIIVSGPLSKNMVLALKKTYESMPEPKLVITLGDCAFDGGIWKGSYYVEKAVSSILPVTLHIPGCPPDPDAIIKALLQLLHDGKSNP